MKMTFSEAGRLGALKSTETKRIKKQKIKETYQKTPNKCNNCGKDLAFETRKNKFCSRSCAASFNNQGMCRNGPKIEGEGGKMVHAPYDKCLFCAKELNRSDKKYCDSRCMSQYKWKKFKEDIEKNGFISVGASGCSRPAKKYLIENRGRRCEICGITEWAGKEVPIVLDHIDGCSDNWKLNNLRLVCGNCDMQLSTYKGRNYGNGRAWRRKRYAEGKSF